MPDRIRRIVEYRANRTNSYTTAPVAGERTPLLRENGNTDLQAEVGGVTHTEAMPIVREDGPSTNGLTTNGTTAGYGTIIVGSPKIMNP